MLWPFGEWNSKWRIFLFHSLSLSLCKFCVHDLFIYLFLDFVSSAIRRRKLVRPESGRIASVSVDGFEAGGQPPEQSTTSAAQLLDGIMGWDWNLTPDLKISNMKWGHENVCKYYPFDYYPAELFTNTLSDLGPCEKKFMMKIDENSMERVLLSWKLAIREIFFFCDTYRAYLLT